MASQPLRRPLRERKLAPSRAAKCASLTGNAFDTVPVRHRRPPSLADALQQALAGCGSTDIIFAQDSELTAAPRNAASATSDALAHYDDSRNGRINCEKARRHCIAPVPHVHPAYTYV